MKRYFLSYRVISSDTPIELDYTSLFSFAQALERTMDNRFVIEHSIDFHTEEPVPA